MVTPGRFRAHAAVVLLLTLVSTATAQYSGGSGTAQDPYQIATTADLILLGDSPLDYGKQFIMVADIDLDPKLPGRKVFDKAMIAQSWESGFTGVFDGNAHRVSHLTIKGKDYGVGLFGYLKSGAEVMDLGVVDVNIAGSGGDVGGLVGKNNGDVTNCYSNGSVSGGGGSVGGLVGCNSWGTVTQCYSAVVVTGDGSIGGLVGENSWATVTQCYSTGSVTGRERGVGGLVGSNGGSVFHCYSTGVVSGKSYVGGLVGSGSSSYVDASACFWDTQTSGQTQSGGGIGLTTAQMQTASTFLIWGTCAGEGIWTIDEGKDYPRLWWENRPGEVVRVGPLSELLAGTGTENDPFLISTAQQLQMIGLFPCEWDKHFRLTADIDLAAFDGKDGKPAFNIIGSGEEYETITGPLPAGTPFIGVFDGNGHTIANFTLTADAGNSYIGLFGYINDPNAQIKDLRLIDPNVTGGSAGGLVGCLEAGTITRCCVEGGRVTGASAVGGLVGRKGHCWGGCAPGADCCWGGTISNSYTAVSVSGSDRVGGLVGENMGTVTACYSTGAVWGNNYVGGLVGTGKTEAGCFWDTQTSGQTASYGGTGKTTAQMQTTSTFLEAGWDFASETANGTEDIWRINEGKDYPRLSWQGPAGMLFVDIAAGTFQMGDHDGVGSAEERPVHTVTLDGFQMSKYETTNGQYAEYLNAAMADGLIQVVSGMVYASSDANRVEPYCETDHPYSQIEYSQGQFVVRSRDGKAMSDHPVSRVTWYGAKAFCDYYGWRLPAEAEWEYAARGRYHDPYYQYPWGSNTIDCSKANYSSSSGPCNPLNLTSPPYTSPVGYYGPQGAYGLCDMSGNVWEWCQDWYDKSYYGVSPESNPTGPTAGSFRVLRGGELGVVDGYCRVAYRYWTDPGFGLFFYGHYGFRVCR